MPSRFAAAPAASNKAHVALNDAAVVINRRRFMGERIAQPGRALEFYSLTVELFFEEWSSALTLASRGPMAVCTPHALVPFSWTHREESERYRPKMKPPQQTDSTPGNAEVL